MTGTDLQQQFFTELKSRLPAHLSLAEEICEILDISSDSAYRRIRGEKALTLIELRTLCEKFHVSLDQVLNLQNDSIVFRAPSINQENVLFSDYLKGVLQQLKYFNSFKEKQMLYLCKDMPVFQFYLFPEIAAFKTFFWIKTLHNPADINGKKFSMAEFSFDDCFVIGQQILQEYNMIPSVELWNLESINSTVHQIEYYRDAGLFKSDDDFDAVVQSFEKTLDHLERQAEEGVKFMPGATDLTYRASTKVYFNEIMLGSNTIFTVLDGARSSFLTYNAINYIMTKDERFNEKSFRYFNTLVSRGTLISGTGEKERTRFFSTLRHKVEELKTKAY